eukprot:g81168.t1
MTPLDPNKRYEQHCADHPTIKLKRPLELPPNVHPASCALCKVSPIVGDLYKCCVAGCAAPILCAPCEAKNNHPPSHALVKHRAKRRDEFDEKENEADGKVAKEHLL